MSVVSVLRLPVHAGAEARLEAAFTSLRIFERARESGGFRNGRLLRPVLAGEPFLVVAEWDDAAAYQGWLDNPVRAELAAQREPLIGGLLETRVYEDVRA